MGKLEELATEWESEASMPHASSDGVGDYGAALERCAEEAALPGTDPYTVAPDAPGEADDDSLIALDAADTAAFGIDLIRLTARVA